MRLRLRLGRSAGRGRSGHADQQADEREAESLRLHAGTIADAHEHDKSTAPQRMSRFVTALHVFQQMRPVELVAVVYFLYLAASGVALGRARAAWLSAGAALLSAGVGMAMPGWRGDAAPAVRLALEVSPLLFLYGGYRIAGLFYHRPNPALERRLLSIDAAIAARWLAVAGAPARRRLRRWLEVAYVAVYPLLPLAALAVAMAQPGRSPDDVWLAVLIAGYVCYGLLPWLPTRPPRLLEATDEGGADGVRRVNLAILERGSVGANTLPSGHAATAVAAALVVCSHAPLAGAAFLVAAAAIAAATVIGRYHYAVDTVLGVIVGVLAAWIAVSS